MANSSSRFFNYDAENRLVYSIMAYSENKKLLDSVEAEDFYDENNQRIITAAKAIQATGKVPDLVTMLDYTHDKSLTERIMGYRQAEAFEDRYKADQYIPLLRDLRLRRDAYRSLQAICLLQKRPKASQHWKATSAPRPTPACKAYCNAPTTP